MSDLSPACQINSESLSDSNGDIVLQNVSLTIAESAKIGLIGPDWGPISVLLRRIAGRKPNVAHANESDESPTVGYLAPEPDVGEALTVADHAVSSSAAVKALFDRYDYINRHYLTPVDDDMHKWLAELEVLEKKIKAMGGWGLDTRMTETLEALRCPLPKTPMSDLPNSARRRVDLCRLVVWRPQLLVLDDATADLDAECVAWLEQELSQYQGAVVFSSRDRALLNSVAATIVAVEGGTATHIDGGYMTWLESRAPSAAPEVRAAAEHELDWMRAGMPGRRAGATPGASGFQRWLSRRGEGDDAVPALSIAPGPNLGDDVISCRGLTGCARERVLFDAVSVSIPPGAIVGVIGAEGAGKSTLLRTLAGLEAPDEGTVQIDGKVVLGFVDTGVELDAAANVLRTISGGRDRLQMGEQAVSSHDFAAAFGFDSAQLDGPVGALSGEMRNRIHLARVLRAGVNALILDETTRDLDTDGLRMLEDALLRYLGSVIVATNDRWFLNRVATHVLAFEGDSRLTPIEGNYDAYVGGRMRRAGLGTIRPNRLRFKRRGTAESQPESAGRPQRV